MDKDRNRVQKWIRPERLGVWLVEKLCANIRTVHSSGLRSIITNWNKDWLVILAIITIWCLCRIHPKLTIWFYSFQLSKIQTNMARFPFINWINNIHGMKSSQLLISKDCYLFPSSYSSVGKGAGTKQHHARGGGIRFPVWLCKFFATPMHRVVLAKQSHYCENVTWHRKLSVNYGASALRTP